MWGTCPRDLSLIDKRNKDVNAIVLDMRAEAIESAKALDKKIKNDELVGPLHGILSPSKSFNIAGYRTTVNFLD